jgi:hypothetical protein
MRGPPQYPPYLCAIGIRPRFSGRRALPGATGARILSQATKELTAKPRGARARVSVCADCGQGTVALLGAYSRSEA